jgi:DNA-binding winged helix-turn-helix (wHTH) protein/TolB-like protein
MKPETSVNFAGRAVPQSIPSGLIRFDRFTLDLRRGTLQSGNHDIQLRPKTFALLKLLAQNSGRLVAKDEIADALWPNVAVTENSVLQCVKELRRALGEDGARLVRTVPRRGFRLEATAAELPSPALAAPIEIQPEQQLRAEISVTPVLPKKAAHASRPWFVTALFLSLVVLGVLWRFGSGGPVALGGGQSVKPSIEVLPFASFDADHDAFASRITDEIVTALGHYPNLTVISHAAVTSDHKPWIAPPRGSGDLSVTYLVRGRVRSVGGQVRVIVELIETHSRHVLWLGRFDDAVVHAPTEQDQVAMEVVGRLAIKIGQAEQLRGQTQTDAAAYLEAYDHVVHSFPAPRN